MFLSRVTSTIITCFYRPRTSYEQRYCFQSCSSVCSQGVSIPWPDPPPHLQQEEEYGKGGVRGRSLFASYWKVSCSFYAPNRSLRKGNVFTLFVSLPGGGGGRGTQSGPRTGVPLSPSQDQDRGPPPAKTRPGIPSPTPARTKTGKPPSPWRTVRGRYASCVFTQEDLFYYFSLSL